MENQRDDLVVILAGYKRTNECILSIKPWTSFTYC